MPAKTNMQYGDKSAQIVQAVGLFATHNQRNTMMGRLTGKMPTGTAGAEATLRKQTTQHMPIVKCEDLGKGRGDEVTFHLLNPTGAKPIMGSAVAEGRGVGMKLSEDRLRVDQARFPIDLGNTMTSIRSPADFRKLGRPVAQGMADKYVDQSLLVHMAGALRKMLEETINRFDERIDLDEFIPDFAQDMMAQQMMQQQQMLMQQGAPQMDLPPDEAQQQGVM